jgi:O-antigen/teichoic acid export membrane protein
MGKKEYYEETIKTLRLNDTKLLQFRILLLIGVFAFGNLYHEHNDRMLLWIAGGLFIALVFTLYFGIKNHQKIQQMHDEYLSHLKEI